MTFPTFDQSDEAKWARGWVGLYGLHTMMAAMLFKNIYRWSKWNAKRNLATETPLVELWDFEIWGLNFNVGVDDIGPETDFTCTVKTWIFNGFSILKHGWFWNTPTKTQIWGHMKAEMLLEVYEGLNASGVVFFQTVFFPDYIVFLTVFFPNCIVFLTVFSNCIFPNYIFPNCIFEVYMAYASSKLWSKTFVSLI